MGLSIIKHDKLANFFGYFPDAAPTVQSCYFKFWWDLSYHSLVMITPAQQLVGYANDDDASGKSVSNGLGHWL